MIKPYQRSSLLALAGAILAYCATPWFGFVFDDRKQVLDNPTLSRLSSIPEYFAHAGGYLVGDLSYYRPLFGTWMNLNYFFFQLHPAGWHISLLLLHMAVVFLCYKLMLATVQEQTTAAIAALLFAVHPVHVESVAWISGGTDPLAAIFILMAFLFYLGSQKNEKKKWISAVFSLLAFFLSLLCKETALLFPFLILAYELLREKQASVLAPAFKRTAPYLIVVAVYLALRVHVLGAFSHTLTPLSPKVLLLTLPSVAAFYLRILFFPSDLSPFYDTPYVRMASFSSFVLPLLALLLAIVLLLWWIRRLQRSEYKGEQWSRMVIFFVLWTVLFLVPALNLSALDPGEIAHDRYLYLPSIGVSCLIAMGLKQLTDKFNLSVHIRAFAITGLGILLCTAAFAQTFFWKDDLALYKRGAETAPNNIHAQNNLGNIYLENGDFVQGIAVHQKILKLDPRSVDSYFNLGLAYYSLGDFAQAQSYFQGAISLRPVARSYYYLGLAQFKKGDLIAAEQSLRAAVQLDRGQSNFHAVLGVLYETENKLPLALQEMEQALSLNPQNQNVKIEAAKIKRQLGQE
jgi:tetratricopeptide (TPR) repeat protein